MSRLVILLALLLGCSSPDFGAELTSAGCPWYESDFIQATGSECLLLRSSDPDRLRLVLEGDGGWCPRGEACVVLRPGESASAIMRFTGEGCPDVDITEHDCSTPPQCTEFKGNDSCG